jgi:mannose/fructose/N-acetylgalactosamine-specific phosphotransferase system component IIC
MLPALGFALLLSQINVKKYWPYLLIGFVLFAYLNMSLIGIALIALAVSIIIMHMEGRSSNAR